MSDYPYDDHQEQTSQEEMERGKESSSPSEAPLERLRSPLAESAPYLQSFVLGFLGIGVIASLMLHFLPLLPTKKIASLFLVLATLGYLFALLFSLGFLRSRIPSPLPGQLGLEWPPSWSHIRYGVVVYLSSLPLLILALLLTQIWSDPSRENIALIRFLKASTVGPLTLLSLFFVTTLVAPIAEEILFRGLLYKGLRIFLGVPGASLLSALIFTLMHGLPTARLPIFILGIILNHLYERTGSLIPGITLHAVNNALATAVLVMVFF